MVDQGLKAELWNACMIVKNLTDSTSAADVHAIQQAKDSIVSTKTGTFHKAFTQWPTGCKLVALCSTALTQWHKDMELFK